MDKENIFTFHSEKRTPVDFEDLASAEEMIEEGKRQSMLILREAIQAILGQPTNL